MNKKNIKKNTVKPAYVVDITNCESLYDTALAFAMAKQKAHQPLTDNDIEIICTGVVEQYVESAPQVVCICETKCEKLPWYKRIWNALKHVFTR